jgi:hypothetical protein
MEHVFGRHRALAYHSIESSEEPKKATFATGSSSPKYDGAVSVFFTVSAKIWRKLFICKGGCFSVTETGFLFFGGTATRRAEGRIFEDAAKKGIPGSPFGSLHFHGNGKWEV